ncbi:NAD(P)H-dependent oxidoreductase [Methylopila sp. M107]|uniref:NAD(P)H-dependent oxidoreductase n=1 Tax=Methylopila sp. M107 TaxID=1101190 RepID=UPI00037E7E07|nr:NAD(P)H-dependent oxidoreductase [Methylopila sp. M107]
MNVLIIYAHPEPQSLNGSLKVVALETLAGAGHDVRVSDLYAMRWKAVADAGDFPDRADPERLRYAGESRRAFLDGTQGADVVAEQEKLIWADAVIFQFPLWWFSAPAILKGWIERVYAYGFAYGVGRHEGERWGDRYGEGSLLGRRALLSITVGGRAPHYSDRGVNGALDDVLWPLQHGTLFYPGMAVLPPHVVYQSDRLTEPQWIEAADAYRSRLRGLFTDEPIAFRRQNGGHYDDRQVLRDGLGADASGTRIHVLAAGDPPQSPLG